MPKRVSSLSGEELPTYGEEEEDVEYECVICGSRIKLSTIEARGDYIRCPNQHCRSRILRKVRPPGIKHVRCD